MVAADCCAMMATCRVLCSVVLCADCCLTIYVVLCSVMVRAWVSESACVIFYFIHLLHHENLLHLTLLPLHRWGFSTSAVTGPQQGGRLALPPGVATQQTLKKLLNRVEQRQSFNLRQQVRFCISYGSLDEKSSNSERLYLLKTNFCQPYQVEKPKKYCIACPLLIE